MEGGWNGGDMRINIHDISLDLKGILSECQTKEFMVDRRFHQSGSRTTACRQVQSLNDDNHSGCPDKKINQQSTEKSAYIKPLHFIFELKYCILMS